MAELSTAAVWCLLFMQFVYVAVCGPLSPFHLKCERSLAGLTQEQLTEVHRQASVSTDNPTPRLSWTIQHTGINDIELISRITLVL